MTRRILLLACSFAAAASCKGGGTDPGTSATIRINITPSSPAIAPGGHVTLHATVTGPPGIAQGVIWQSLSPDVATITGAGVVTGIAEGAAVIKASWAQDLEEFNTINVLVTTMPIENPQPVAAPRATPKG